MAVRRRWRGCGSRIGRRVSKLNQVKHRSLSPVSYSNFISFYLSYTLCPCPIPLRISFFVLALSLSSAESVCPGEEDSNDVLYLSLASSHFIQSLHILSSSSVSLRSPFLPRCDTSIYLSISPRLVMSVHSPFLYSSIHPFVTFFFSLPPTSQPACLCRADSRYTMLSLDSETSFAQERSLSLVFDSVDFIHEDSRRNRCVIIHFSV